MNRNLRLTLTRARFASRRVNFFLPLVLATLLVSSIPFTQVHAAAGDLDPSFGTGGKVVSKIGDSSSSITDIALQSDGKIVAVGFSSAGYSLVRYNTDGSLDQTFGNGGKAISDTSPPYINVAFGIALQSDGKILIAGHGSGGTFNIDFAVTRYNTDGSLDQSFGNGGTVVTDFFNGQDEIYGIAVQRDGKIVVSGRAGQAGVGFLFAVARYNSDGTLDNSFGNGGKVTHDFSDPRAFGIAVQSATETAIQSDGKIVVVGTALSFPTFYDIVTVRFNPDGSLDTSFGSGGKVLTDFANSSDDGTTLVIQPDGKVIVGGSTFVSPSHTDFGLLRFNTDGSPDPSFGVNGKVHTDFAGYYDRAFSVALLNDGRIVLAGETYTPGTGYDFAIAQYNSDGSIHSGFGNGGKVQTDFFAKWDRVVSVAIQSDGKIIAGGNASSYQIDQGDFALARYDGDGGAFNTCVQDESNGNLLQINSLTGDYQFANCSGFTLGGTGTLKKKGSVITLEHNASDRRVTVKIDDGVNKATASIQVFSRGATFTITDRNTLNNTCTCK